jgi:hypothetical protein
MNLFTIKVLLEMSIQLNGGSLKAMKACDNMYSQIFRTEAFTLASFFELNPNFDSDEISEIKETLFSEMAIACYSASANAQKYPPTPKFDFDTDDDQFEHIVDAESDHYYEQIEEYKDIAVKWLKNTFPTFEINKSTEVVDFCNYKGEGEGEISLFETNKYLPVFISKRHSFHQVNG